MTRLAALAEIAEKLSINDNNVTLPTTAGVVTQGFPPEALTWNKAIKFFLGKKEIEPESLNYQILDENWV